MISLIRGKNNILDTEWLEGLSDFSILVQNNIATFSIDNLSTQLLDRILDKNIEYNLYFTKFDDKVLYLLNSYNAKLISNSDQESISINIENIADLKEISDEDKIEWLINNVKSEVNFRLLNESINKGTLSIDSLIKKVVIENA